MEIERVVKCYKEWKMVGSLTERERFYGSLKTSKITWHEDLYGKPLECDWGAKPIPSPQILLLSNALKIPS